MRPFFFTTISVIAFLIGSSASALPFPQPLDLAIAVAEYQNGLTASFTMRATHPVEGTVLLRYDARQQSWTVLEGNLDSISEPVRNELAHLQSELSRPGELTYGGMRQGILDPNLVSETDNEYIYHAIMGKDGDRDVPEEMREAVDAELIVDKVQGHITYFSLRSKHAFKPAAAAKVDLMVVEQEYQRLPGGGPAVLTRLYNKAQGRALFKPFNEEFTLEFSDYDVISY